MAKAMDWGQMERQRRIRRYQQSRQADSTYVSKGINVERSKKIRKLRKAQDRHGGVIKHNGDPVLVTKQGNYRVRGRVVIFESEQMEVIYDSTKHS